MPSPEKTYTLSEVFGINRDTPLNYVVRSNIDDVLIDQLTRDQHLVIHGSSKQGKTCLRKNCLSDDDYIVVTCLNKWSLRDLYGAILKQTGYEIRQSSKITVSGKHKVEAEFKADKAKLGYGYEKSSGTEDIISPLELDFEDPNDIITALSQINFDKFIVLEDYRSRPSETSLSR